MSQQQSALFDAPQTGITLFIDGAPIGKILSYSADYTRALVERRLDDGVQQLWYDLPQSEPGATAIPQRADYGPDPLIARVRDIFWSAGYNPDAIQFYGKGQANFKAVFPQSLDALTRQQLAEAVQPLVAKLTLSFDNTVSLTIPPGWDSPDAAADGALSVHAVLAAEEPPLPSGEDIPTTPLPADVLAAIHAAALHPLPAIDLPEADFDLVVNGVDGDTVPLEAGDVQPIDDEDDDSAEFISLIETLDQVRALNERLQHAEARAAALDEALKQFLNPQPVRKEVWTLTHDLDHIQSDDDLAQKLNDGWEVLNITVNTFIDRYSDDVRMEHPRERHIRIVTLVRDAQPVVAEPTPPTVRTSVMIDPMGIANLFAEQFPLAYDLRQRGYEAVQADLDAQAMEAAHRAKAQYRAAFPTPRYTAIPGRL